jgi:probable HAF family extracellular repeat protein
MRAVPYVFSIILAGCLDDFAVSPTSFSVAPASQPEEIDLPFRPLSISESGWIIGVGVTPNTSFLGRNGSYASTPLLWSPSVNNAGSAVGNYNARATIWNSKTGLLLLPTLGGFSSEGAAINNSGQVAGASANAEGHMRAFFWSEQTGMIELPLPESPPEGVLTVRSYATDINDHGAIVGLVNYIGGVPERTIAFHWSAEEGSKRLDGLGGRFVRATAINNRGDVVGVSTTPTSLGEPRPVVWTRAQAVRQLPTFGSREGIVYDINERGYAVGYSFTEAGDRMSAVYWDPDGVIHELHRLEGWWDSYARAVNNRGQVVGGASSEDGEGAFMWRIW